MSLNHAVATRNAMLQALIDLAGANAVLQFRDGAKPANAAASRTGTLLASMALGATPFAAPSGGSVTKNGTWQDSTADASGTLGYWTLYKADGTTVVTQGSVTVTGGGGDITVVSTTITAGQPFTISTFSITAGNA